MTKYNSEIEVKQALGIDSFRNLSKDNVMRFAALMPDMDKEVALKIVEQFPEFRAFAMDAVNVMEQAHEAALDDNMESQTRVHNAWAEVRQILQGQLGDENMTWEQKKHILELIMVTAQQDSAKDSENKQFLKEMARTAAFAIGTAVLVGVVFVGGRIGWERLGGDNDDK